MALTSSAAPGNRTATFEVYPDRNGEYRWRLRGANGEIVAASQAYSDKDAAKQGIEDTAADAAAAAEAPIEERDQ